MLNTKDLLLYTLYKRSIKFKNCNSTHLDITYGFRHWLRDEDTFKLHIGMKDKNIMEVYNRILMINEG